MDFVKDLFGFLMKRRKFWLLPAILVLLILMIFVALSSGSAIAPFIYALF